MRIGISLTALGAAAMTAAIVYGFAAGDGWDEVAKLWALPWGKVSLVDVYIGFALFCGWVVYREASAARATVWILLILCLGNAITCLYALLALIGSRGDWCRFWLGGRLD